MKTSIELKVTAAMRAEASAWVARLHGPNRDARTEAGFRAWLQVNAAHVRAFEQTTEAWEAVGGVSRERMASMVRWERLGARRGWGARGKYSLAAAAVVLGVAVGLYVHNAPITTAVGEQRVVTLQDGTRVHLNTATRLRVYYDRRVRRVELEEGEALFDVARGPDRPFVVTVGAQRVTALGTSFLVRRDSHQTTVTLVDGKVAVRPTQAQQASQVLAPGQRLAITDGGRVSLDRPVAEQVAAWQRGLVILDAIPLREAVAEMNRYSETKLEVSNIDSADIRISGAFRTGDSLSFAHAVAKTYQLDVREGEGEIALTGAPRATYQ